VTAQFGYLAGTGRTGTHWLRRFFHHMGPLRVVARHERFGRRARVEGCADVGAMLVRFEDLFGPGVSLPAFEERLRGLMRHLRVPPKGSGVQWWGWRNTPVAMKNVGDGALMGEEVATVDAICGGLWRAMR